MPPSSSQVQDTGLSRRRQGFKSPWGRFSSLWFPFINFKVIYQIQLKENIKLPSQIYSIFRGAFGKNLKKISCALRSIKSCQDCKLNLSCAYSYLFETPKPPNIKRLKKYPYLPHPFSFSIPYPLFRNNNLTNKLEINMVLIGKGIHFFPHIALALKIISKNFYPSKFEIFNLENLIDVITGKTLLKEEEIKFPEPVSLKTLVSHITDLSSLTKLKIITISPLSLKFQNKVTKPEEFNFSILIRNLLRRISNLAYFHCEKDINLDFKSIIEISQNIAVLKKDFKLVRIKRKSQRTGQIYAMPGLMGEAIFEGNLAYFYPFLLLGSFVQVGKYTSFGFGKYKLELL